MKIFSAPARLLLGVAILVAGTYSAHAGISGTNADHVTVTVKTKQGGEWITARKEKTDTHGVLTLKGALPGKYKFIIDRDDVQSGQTLALKIKLLDENGRQANDERLDVNVYVYAGATKILAAATRSDKDGWLDLVGVTSGTTYELDVKDHATLRGKHGKPRIKMKAKIDGSNWFTAAYKRTKGGVLKVEDVLPGKYKFSYKRKDVANANMPFTLKARFRNADGKRVRKATVKIYAYPFGIKTFVGKMKTDSKGWLTIPGVMPHMKYKVTIKD